MPAFIRGGLEILDQAAPGPLGASLSRSCPTILVSSPTGSWEPAAGTIYVGYDALITNHRRRFPTDKEVVRSVVAGRIARDGKDIARVPHDSTGRRCSWNAGLEAPAASGPRAGAGPGRAA